MLIETTVFFCAEENNITYSVIIKLFRKILHLTHGLPHIPVASPVADLSNQNVAMTVFSSVTRVLIVM